MAKKLLLVRHGKSDHGHDLKDFDRPLNHRGNKNAVEMAERSVKRDLVPQLVISSPAVRAITTAAHFIDLWDIPKAAVEKDESIYEANTMALLNVINKIDNDFDLVALFGHNPGLTELTNYLTNSGVCNIPTSGMVLIEFDLEDWAEISKHTGSMLLFDFPKNTDEPH